MPSSNNKIAVVGDKDSVLAFRAIGVDVFTNNDVAEAETIIKKLARDYTIIFVTEEIAIAANELLQRYKARPFPAIIPIPSADGSNGYGMRAISKNVEKAIGSDILKDR